MRVDMTNQEELARFAEPMFGLAAGEMAPDMVLLGIYDATGKVQAVFGVNAVYGHYCTMHIASAGSRAWATRSVLRLIFGYVFDHLALKRANGIVRANDLRTQILALKLGFRFEGAVAAGADDGSDGILFGMLAENCPWLKEKDRG